MKDFALGQYVAYDSIIHRLDAREKVLSLILLMIAVFWGYNTFAMTFLMGGVLLGFVIVLMIISHVNFKQLFGSLKAMWFLVIFLLLINILIKPSNQYELEGVVAFSIGSFDILWASILQSLKIILRLVMMISLTMILTATTRPLELTYALEWYMTPLKLIKFPAHEIAMTISIALRFIPTLLDETNRIMNAQASRGVDFKHGRLKSRFRAIVSLIVPLFVSAFQRSEELANAMEARGYDPSAKRTRYRTLRFHFGDLVSFIISGGIMSAVISVASLGFKMETPHFLGWYFIAIAILISIFLIIGICSNFTNKKANK